MENNTKKRETLSNEKALAKNGKQTANNDSQIAIQKTLSVMVTIVTLLCLLLGNCTVVRESCKIVGAGGCLMLLNYNATAYDESYRKTDQGAEEYLEIQAEREEFYQSEDTVIREYSNLPGPIKLAVWFLAVFAIPGVPLLSLLYVIREAYSFSIRRKKEKQRSQKAKRQ